MKIVSDKITRLSYLTDQINAVEKVINLLQPYAQENVPARGEGSFRVYDKNGANGETIKSQHLLAYPGAVRELLQLRLEKLEKERDEIAEVLSVAERLFQSLKVK